MILTDDAGDDNVFVIIIVGDSDDTDSNMVFSFRASSEVALSSYIKSLFLSKRF